MSTRQQRQGIALVMTLVVTTLLAMLTAAFVTVSRSNSAITGNLVSRQDAYNACLSGLHYAWSELERNEGFGAGGFPSGMSTKLLPTSLPEFRIRVFGDTDEPDDLDLNFLQGEMLATGDTFEIQLVNNLGNRNTRFATSLGDVPGRCTRMKVVGTSGGKSLTLTSVLRKSPFVDSSALSSYDMGIELIDDGPLNKWSLRSKDPYVNQVRSNMNINGPSAVGGNLQFSDPPRGGVAMAHDDIKLDGQSISSDPDFQADSQNAANGSFQTNTGRIDVPDLDRSNLSFPETEVAVPAGEMEMKVVEVHNWIETDLGGGVVRWQKQVFEHNAIEHAGSLWVSASNELKSDSGVITDPSQGYDAPDSTSGVQGTTIVPGPFQDRPTLYDDGEVDSQHKMVADLTTGQITLSPGTTFAVDGNFRIKQNDDAHQAHLFFAYEFEGEDVVFKGGDNAMDNAEANSAVLSTTGDLFIDGITTGFGSLYSDKSVDLRAKSGLRAEQDLAVAVHGDSINFTAEEPPDTSLSNTLSQAEFVAFADALGPGYDSYDLWFGLESGPRHTRIGTDPTNPTGLRSKRLSQDGDYYWNLIMADLGRSDSPPNWSSLGPEWTGNLSLEQFVRLQEHAKTGSQTWFDMPGPGFQSVTSQIDSRISTYSVWADRMNLPMSQYMQEEIPTVADVYFVGLVHAGTGGFFASANRASMLFEGSLVSQGQLRVVDAKALDFVYNRRYLDDVVKQYVGSSRASLDQVYFRVH